MGGREKEACDLASKERLLFLNPGVSHHLREASVLGTWFPKFCLVMSPGFTANPSGGYFEFLYINGTSSYARNFAKPKRESR